MTTWEQCADEFAQLDSGEGWPFAALVACAVQPGLAGRPPSNRADRRNSKVSVREFASRARTSDHRVARYLTAWDRAAAAGACTPSADLTPDDHHTVELPDLAWGSVYDASGSGGRPRASAAEIAKGLDRSDDFAERVIEQASPEAIARIAAHPKVAVEASRQRNRHRPIVDPAPPEPRATSADAAVSYLLAGNEADRAISAIADLVRRGAFDGCSQDVRDEALANIRRWSQTLDFAAAIISGDSVTDASLARWLAAG